MSADDYSAGWQMEDDELVRRLSKLDWAPVPEDLRERCWMAFEQRISQQGDADAPERSRAAFNVGERYEMRRFAPARRLSVAELPLRGLTSPGRGIAASARLAATQVGRAPVARRAVSLT